MKRTNITNIVLGIIAAEVVLQAVQSFAARPLVARQSSRSAEEQPPEARVHFLLAKALSQAAGLLRRLFFGSEADTAKDSQGGRERIADASHHGRGANEADTAEHEDDGVHLKGSMQGIAEKLKDPAWAGVLAANDGNVSLTEAERAVPMPGSAQFVQRLDKNPFVGQGMKDHSRDKV